MTETDPNPINLDPLRNKLDPIKKTGPDKQHELFRNLSRVCHGFGADEVIGASINLLVNTIRQAYGHQDMAERRWNELFGQFKTVLLGHYDSVTKKRRNIFPFTQHIHMAFFDADDKHHKS